ncbi:MAG: hypothetical protein OXH10_08705 [bacterium]|nr:hypothetical protein [bacterium]MCY3580772.1 hypothetical protein [bacterium]
MTDHGSSRLEEDPICSRLGKVSTKAGLFTVLAIDHVGSFAQTVRPDRPDSMTGAQIVEAKHPIIAALGPISRAVLIDPAYLAVRSSAGKGEGALTDLGLIVGIEDGDYADVLTTPRLLAGWNAERAAELGADAVKISMYFDPRGDSSAAEAFVTEVVDQCRKADVPLFCEPLALYQAPEERANAVLEGVRRFGGLGADVLKLQFPALPEASEDRAVWDQACAEINRLSPVPWVILSEGGDYGLFRDQVEIAGRAGASGFLGGRAIWREMATDRSRTREAQDRLTELSEVAHAHGIGWRASRAERRVRPIGG